MATSKTTAKKSTSKPGASKKTVAKKTVASKASVLKATAKRPATKKSATKKHEMRSFRVAREEHSFTNFQITRQTVYWIILIVFIVFVQLWILKLQIEVATLIDAQQAQLQSL